jgi:hypothetical protein
VGGGRWAIVNHESLIVNCNRGVAFRFPLSAFRAVEQRRAISAQHSAFSGERVERCKVKGQRRTGTAATPLGTRHCALGTPSTSSPRSSEHSCEAKSSVPLASLLLPCEAKSSVPFASEPRPPQSAKCQVQSASTTAGTTCPRGELYIDIVSYPSYPCRQRMEL